MIEHAICVSVVSITGVKYLGQGAHLLLLPAKLLPAKLLLLLPTKLLLLAKLWLRLTHSHSLLVLTHPLPTKFLHPTLVLLHPAKLPPAKLLLLLPAKLLLLAKLWRLAHSLMVLTHPLPTKLLHPTLMLLHPTRHLSLHPLLHRVPCAYLPSSHGVHTTEGVGRRRLHRATRAP